MGPITCPGCGQQAADKGACPHCGHALGQADGLADGKLPPDLLDWARRTFDEEEFLAGLREVERTGGVELKDFIHELGQKASDRE